MTSDVSQGAVALIFDDLGNLLLHLRDDIPGISWPGYWSVLGGGCDPGESPREAIERELSEEAGLTADGLVELFQVRDEFGSGQLITFFAGRWNGRPDRLTLSEGVELRFFPPQRLPDLRIPPYIRTAINRVLADDNAW
ncbi:NUDIX hydrolase [Micromonospora cremea]|uniref:8-oxo-dGTP diphosphatase n=1 Tax=Micromonospora cremea TaxID=709881 RepID=A0A1N5W6G9_9ACTN|nr:NUDIX domain-containing protein [Micromonospora cremea]SIM80065.1 8-oxo-dGTP diphosphatase [Micromonospora cremea]